MAFSGYHRPCQRRYLSLELHRQCILPALAVVGGVDGVNIPPPARELCGVIPADTVELHGMDAAQRTDKPLRAVLPVVQLYKVHHAPQDSRPEGIRSALPRFHDVPQGFAVDFFGTAGTVGRTASGGSWRRVHRLRLCGTGWRNQGHLCVPVQ